MIQIKERSIFVVIAGLIISILILPACKQNAQQSPSKGIAVQRLLLQLELNEEEGEYDKLPSILDEIKMNVGSKDSLINNVDLVNFEDMLANIDRIKSSLDDDRREGIVHEIDNLKIHLEELQTTYGGDDHLYTLWNFEMLLHIWMPKTKSEYLDQKVQDGMDAVHAELKNEMRALTLTRISHDLLEGDENKFNAVQSHKNDLIYSIDKFLLLDNEVVSFDQFNSSLEEVQQSIKKYMRLML